MKDEASALVSKTSEKTKKLKSERASDDVPSPQKTGASTRTKTHQQNQVRTSQPKPLDASASKRSYPRRNRTKSEGFASAHEPSETSVVDLTEPDPEPSNSPSVPVKRHAVVATTVRSKCTASSEAAASAATALSKRRKTSASAKTTKQSSACLNENEEDFFNASGKQRWVIPKSDVKVDLSSSAPIEAKLWIDKYEPLSEAEIAVNNKKVADVRAWLQNSLAEADVKRQRSQPHSKLLVLTGPSGAGKTAVIRLLSRELHFEVSEWSNPVNTNAMNVSAEDHHGAGRGYGAGYFSLTRSFPEFLAAASKTPILSFRSTTVMSTDAKPELSSSSPENDRKIILIEDLPNIANDDTRKAVHGAIRSYLRSPRTRYPLVFIVTDTTSDYGERDTAVTLETLIPPDVREANFSKQIKFNAIAPTYLIKALTRIAAFEFKYPLRAGVRPDKQAIDTIARSSGGDIRCALNAMQFFTLQETAHPKSGPGKSKKTPRGKKDEKPVSQSLNLGYVGCREVNLDMFHWLGRILYNKRERDENVESITNPSLQESLSSYPTKSERSLPSFLLQHKREPLKSNPEQAFENAHMDADIFSLFLHHNCPSFFKDIEELAVAGDYMSTADVLGGKWENRQTLGSYTASITSRGLLYSHTNPVPPQRFHQLYGPRTFQVARKAQRLFAAAKNVALTWLQRGSPSKGDDSATAHASVLTATYPAKALIQDLFPYVSIFASLAPSQHNIPSRSAPGKNTSGSIKSVGGPQCNPFNIGSHPPHLLASLSELLTWHRQPLGQHKFAAAEEAVEDAHISQRPLAVGQQPLSRPVLEDDISDD
ncbi:Rad17 cell cycle checkpoint protein-domain-containing protein [Powellomyces hirtus]|nr:Rad17 cell cycle checkpoint protein-domain-containing protein [Powellomyces hirtus]